MIRAGMPAAGSGPAGRFSTTIYFSIPGFNHFRIHISPGRVSTKSTLTGARNSGLVMLGIAASHIYLLGAGTDEDALAWSTPVEYSADPPCLHPANRIPAGYPAEFQGLQLVAFLNDPQYGPHRAGPDESDNGWSIMAPVGSGWFTLPQGRRRSSASAANRPRTPGRGKSRAPGSFVGWYRSRPAGGQARRPPGARLPGAQPVARESQHDHGANRTLLQA